MKPITKQLIIGAFILVLVTIASFGIRQVRLSAYRADSGLSTPSARPSDTEDQSQPEQPLYVNTGPDNYPADSLTVDTEPDPQYSDVLDWDEEIPIDDNSEENIDTIKYDKTVSKAKSFKGGYAKSVGKNSLQKISLSNAENIYITEKGEAWYVSKEPGGNITKMQVQIDDYTGQITPVGGGEYAVKTEGSQGPQRIPMGEYENIYLTEEGEAWYVSEQPDGSTAKVQLQPE